jgi:diaminopimelate decarboxylase
VESRHELTRLSAAAQRAGTVAKVLFRVNIPGAPAGVLTMGGLPSPFGMDPAEADTCATDLPTLPGIEFRGIHAHLGSGLDPEPCAAQGIAVIGWAQDYARRHRLPLREINIGGGMAVDYRRPHHRFDWHDYAIRLPDNGTVVRIEPGRALTAYSGWYATRILDLKRSHGEWFAICAGGTHHLRTPAAKGHDQPLTVFPMGGNGTDEPVTYVGQLCTPKDVLARNVHSGHVARGDLVVFALAGAYAYNISHRDFLMHPPPAVVHTGSAD